MASPNAKDTNILVFLALGNAKDSDAKVPNANVFASQWNVGFSSHNSFFSSCYKLIVVDALHKRDIQQIIPKAKKEFLERHPQADREMVETFDPLKTWEAPAPPRTYPTHTRFNDLPPVPRQDSGVPMVPIDTRPMSSFFNNLPLQILQTDPPVNQASRTPRSLPEPPASQGSIQSRPVQMGHLSSVASEDKHINKGKLYI